MPHERFGDSGGGEVLLPLLGTLVPLFFLAGVVLLAVLLLRGRWAFSPWRPMGAPPAPPPADPALIVLRDRYARGEIDTAEYEERRLRLLGHHDML